MKITKKFNLIEIALALGILGLGLTSIVSLFPVGFQEINDSVGESYSSIATESIQTELHSISYNDWDDIKNNDFIPSTEPNVSDNSTLDPNQWEKISEDSSLYYTELSNSGIFGALVTSDNENIIQFEGMIKIWKKSLEPASSKMKLRTRTGNIINLLQYIYNKYFNREPFDTGAGIYLEISWPARKPYNKRKKKNYYFELYNKNV